MMVNVFINHYRRGKLVEERHVHNSWAERGRQYLSYIISENTPGLGVENRRLKYMSLGIGGTNRSGIVLLAPLAASHSPGNDPRGTAGDVYTRLNLTGSGDGSVPPVTTLEMPARVSGASSPPDDYPDAITNASDVWYIQDPDLYITMLGQEGLAVHAFVDCTTPTSDYIYDVFTQMPISEAGLHLGDIDINQPYEPLVAYVNFGTITLDAESQLEVIWSVRFAP